MLDFASGRDEDRLRLALGMIPLLAPSGGMAEDDAADFSGGGLTAELQAAGSQLAVGHEKMTGMDVYTSNLDQPPSRGEWGRSASG